ncbi:hypothetical protein OOT55_11995 [Marinimicrobium sp. C6131]|uniref:hypothetical protein n=1 Tax=Marinimicrobium sp. C6131 TaxID=3022676 RepID=UPI00223D76C6|nr:hypothetical protein [Marinimicrobium sp. C6131]UZJ43373.1 hypothetical protein OOT55_11995 [Marinimicrobium sp. C6131]
MLTLDGEEQEGSLVPALYSPDDSVVSDPAGTGPDGETVWSVQFNGTEAGSVFLSTEGSAYDNRLSLTDNMQQEGAIEFDLYVEAINADTELYAKIDSGWPNVSVYEIVDPAEGEWISFSVPISDLEANPAEDGQADYGNILNAFVLEALNGTAIVHLNNIRYTCEVEDCAIEANAPADTGDGETLNIFMGDLTSAFNELGVFNGNIEIETLNDADLGTNVFEFVFSEAATNSGPYIVAPAGPQNLEAYAGGEVVFDLKVVDAASNTSGFLIKADHNVGGVGGSSAELSIPLPDNNDWNEIRVPIDDYTSTGLDLSGVTAAFVMFPVFNEQAGMVYRVGNIRWVAATEGGDNDDTPSEPAGELNEVHMTPIVGGSVRFSIRLPEVKDNVQLFARINGAQDYVIADLGQRTEAITDNGDGTFTYEILRESAYADGDLIEARFYSYSPDAGQIFYPGPADDIWAELTYLDSEAVEDDQGGSETGSGDDIVDGEVDEIVITDVENGGAQFTVRLSEEKADLQLFARRNGAQDYVVGLADHTVIDNGDGTYTYSVTRTGAYEAGDLIEARYFTYLPESGQIFLPGPGDDVWASSTYGE